MSGSLTIVGLGPAGLDRVSPRIRALVTDPRHVVIVRTMQHPAATDLAELRDIESCDDIYEEASDFDDVYRHIAGRIVERTATRSVVYAVPGSAVVGEHSVRLLRGQAADRGLEIDIVPGESFLDLVWERTGCDPIADGAQVLDGRDLPSPLQLHLPTVVTQIDRPEVLADVSVELGRVLPADAPITVLDALGGGDERLVETTLAALTRVECGPRTSLYLDPPDNGWVGLVATNRLLREQCPWDQKQTHHSLVKHLIEETYETVDVIDRLAPHAPDGDVDFGAYAELEEELGDLLLQVVFHATLAEEPGAFGVEEVAEGIRRKLVARHPHVFGDVDVADAEAVNRNWESLKSAEKGRSSAMDDVPVAMPAIARADKLQRRAGAVGFDWPSVSPVLAKLHEEVAELDLALAAEDGGEIVHELGDVLFSVVNLARHAGVDAEMAMRRANGRFDERFRGVENLAVARRLDLKRLSLDELDALWDEVKDARTRLGVYGSLAPGTPNHHVLSGIEGDWWPAAVRGLIHNPDWQTTGGYPAFEFDASAEPTELLVFESAELPQHWAMLDAFEASEGYKPVVADAVRADGAHVSVTLYEGPQRRRS